MKKKPVQKWTRYYYLFILLLFLVHVLFALNSINQIRYEELAETVRNVFWLDHHLIYDGISTNIGWPAMLLIIYKIFGFGIFTAKYARLVLVLISLICSAALLKRLIGPKLAWLPLLTIALSPTLLFFSTMQAQYGMDLLYLPISLLFFYLLDFEKPPRVYLIEALAWTTAMLGWMSYPSFVFYLPAIGIYYLSKLKTNQKKIKIDFLAKNFLISLISFLWPLTLIYTYVQNKQVLISDPVTKSGIFRGAGVFNLNFDVLGQNLGLLSSNLFDKSFGYYFDLKNVEFSLFFPLIGLGVLVYLNWKIYVSIKKMRLYILLVLLTLWLNLFFSGMTTDFTAGIRRFTPTLVSIYVLFIAGWWYVNTEKFKEKKKKWLLMVALLLIPIHHLVVLPDNFSSAGEPSLYKDWTWSAQSETPEVALRNMVDQIQKEDLKLACKDKSGQLAECRYSEIYPAVAGSCLWNRLQCHQIYGFDQKSKNFIPLSVDLWDSYYLGH